MAPFRVVIIGGGLSGPLLGNGLMNNNVDFTLYERDNENARYEGYQIRLGEGALRGFSACLTPAHQETIMRKLGKSVDAVETAPSLFTSGFEQLLDLTTVQSYSKSAAINRVVLRDLLMEPLRRNTKVEYQKEFVDYEAVPGSGGAADKIKVNFRDGSSDTCDILVGADGSHSKVITLKSRTIYCLTDRALRRTRKSVSATLSPSKAIGRFC
jgi:2-polyprenyl-6-methoxyphenol hydroxylase-like FAD-dependent oxidoreductase